MLEACVIDCVALRCRPAQFAEETKKADKVVPRGIVWSVIGTAILGWTFLLSLLTCIQVRLGVSPLHPEPYHP